MHIKTRENNSHIFIWTSSGSVEELPVTSREWQIKQLNIFAQAAIQTPFTACIFFSSVFWLVRLRSAGSFIFCSFIFFFFFLFMTKTVCDIKRNWVLCEIECVCVGDLGCKGRVMFNSSGWEHTNERTKETRHERVWGKDVRSWTGKVEKLSYERKYLSCYVSFWWRHIGKFIHEFSLRLSFTSIHSMCMVLHEMLRQPKWFNNLSKINER